MSDIMSNLNWPPIIAIGGSMLFFMVAVIAGCITSVAKNKQREQTKREVAAYLAEGSITPDDAKHILRQ